MRGASTVVATLSCALAAMAGPLAGQGAAEPPTEVRARVIAGPSWTRSADDARTDFTLSKAELGARLALGPHLALDAQVDAVRSASPSSLFGVSGNALVLVLSRAYGEVALDLGPGRLEARMGLVPDPVVDAVEDAQGLRVMADPLAESGAFHWRSDIGATLGWRGLDDRLALTLAVTTGEGARDVELDDAKDLLVLARGDLWTGRLFDAPARLRLAAGYRVGTRGIASVDDDRAFALAALLSQRLGLGLEAHLAFGYDARADREVRGLGAWVRAMPWEVMGFGLRLDWMQLDAAVTGSDRVVVEAGVIADLAAAFGIADRTFRLFAGWRGERVGASAAAVTGLQSTSDADSLLLVLEVATTAAPVW